MVTTDEDEQTRPGYGHVVSLGGRGRREEKIALEDLAREVWAMRSGAALLAPGYLVRHEFSSTGGTIKEGGRSRKDNPTLDETARKLIGRARYILDTHAVRYYNGDFFVPTDEWDRLDVALAEEREAAQKLNRVARAAKSDRLTTIEIYRYEVDPSDRRAAERLGRDIRERLIALRESFSAGEPKPYQLAMAACRDVDKLVSGTQRESLRLALRSADSQRTLMIAHYGGRRGASELRREFKDRLPDLDYSAVDAAIAMFSAPAATSGSKA